MGGVECDLARMSIRRMSLFFINYILQVSKQLTSFVLNSFERLNGCGHVWKN